MAGFRGIMISIFLIVLFTFYILGFALSFINATNPTSDVLNNDKYHLNASYRATNTTLNNFNSLSDNIKTQFLESEPSATDYLYLIFQSAFYIPKTIFISVVGGFVSILLILESTLSLSFGSAVALVAGLAMLGAVMIISMILLIIKIIRTGESER